jgi:5-methylcytosine-specific restriction enzyme subunit McrC
MPAATISKEVTIREFGFLYRGGSLAAIDEFSIPLADWDWLWSECLRPTGAPDFLRPMQRQGRTCLQAQNYVGSVETPSGLRIEILPKISGEDVEPARSRRTLLKMLRRVLNLRMAAWDTAQIQLFDQPLHEVLIEFFLTEVEKLVKKGLRSQNVQQEDEQPFLRGRLRVEKQLHRRPGAKPKFSIEFHEFLIDSPENRLIRSAVENVSKWARGGSNQRRSRALRFLLADLPGSTNYRRDFQAWSQDRCLADYRPLRPWCELILKEQTPHTLAGAFFGISFLFPMERLFEKYVEAILRTRMAEGWRLIGQARRHSLVLHRGEPWFWLRPDLMVEREGRPVAVLDAKWKQISALLDDPSSKYGLSESDFYQMAVYGQRYLKGSGELFLVFPRSEWFQRPLEAFEFSDSLRLWVVPFDLDSDCLVQPEFSGCAEWLKSGG